MSTAALHRRWLQARRFRQTVRELRALPASHLKALGIRQEEICRLAAEACRV